MAFCLLFPMISRWLLTLHWLPAPVIPIPALIIAFWWRLAWIVCGFATVSGYFIHDVLVRVSFLILSECLCTHGHSWSWALTINFSAVLVRSLGDLAWWWQSRCCPLCPSPSFGGTSVLGLPLSSLLSVLSGLQNWHLHHPSCCQIGRLINTSVLISISPYCVLAQKKLYRSSAEYKMCCSSSHKSASLQSYFHLFRVLWSFECPKKVIKMSSV